jgi:ligand-binding sensor domain-containing protein
MALYSYASMRLPWLGWALSAFTLAATSAPAASRQLPAADLVQELWEARDGSLPHPTVTALKQTRDGYLWIGTYTGLVRFDGLHFQLHEQGSSDLSDHIRALDETSDGTLWIATRRQGLFRRRNGRTESANDAVGLTRSDVRALAADGDTLWLGSGLTVTEWNVVTRKARHFPVRQGAGGTITALHIDARKTLWVGTTGLGLARWDGARFQDVPLGFSTEGREREAVGAIAHDKSGALWLGTGAGVVRLTMAGDDGAMRMETVVPSRCLSLGAGPSAVWAATEAGLYKIDESGLRHYAEEALVFEQPAGLFEDAVGSVWIGTRRGLVRLRPRVVQSYAYRDGGARFGVVNCVLETRDGDVWVGSIDGLSRLHDGKWTTYDKRHGLPHTYVRGLAEGPDGALWVATQDGVARFENGRGTPHLAARSPFVVRALAVDAQNRPWFGAPQPGITRLENGVLSLTLTAPAFCAPSSACFLLFTRDGTLRVGTERGLVHVRDGKATCDIAPNVMRNDIRHLLEGDDGRLWIGTIGGLSVWDKGGLRAVAGQGGPFNAAVYGIVDDGRGALWFSTPKGLFRILKSSLAQEAADGTPPVFRYFGTGEGMESSIGAGDGQPNASRGPSGRLYFATIRGVAMVDPTRLQVSPLAPPVNVHALTADQRSIPLDGVPRLAAGTRNLQVDFSAVNFVAPEMIQYKYKLEGFDVGWVASGSRRTAYYTNLSPGRYVFRVTAANPDGIWGAEGAVVQFELLPYFYQRRWFAPLCAALLVVAAGAAYRIRVGQLRRRQQELQDNVNAAVAQIKTLRGLLPICASCKKIRDDTGYWNQMETYIQDHSGADFSHSICPDCMATLYPDYAAHLRGNAG